MLPLSVVIINWNTSDHLIRCIESFLGEGLAPSTILVVDQDSTDGSLAVVKGRFPEVRTLSLPNVSYAHAANVGVEAIDSEYAIISNADVIVRKGAIERIVRTFQEDRQAALVGPRLVDHKGRNTTRFSRTSVIRAILLELFPRSMRGVWRDAEQLAHAETYFFPVSYVEGSFMAVRREAYLEVGGMDEGFSFFFEDADLPMRISKLGYQVMHEPRAVVTHIGGASFSKVPAKHASEFHRNMVRLYVRHAMRRAVHLRRWIRSIARIKIVSLSLASPFIGSIDGSERIIRNRLINGSLAFDPLETLSDVNLPLVSVIIPTYGRRDVVEQLVRSFSNQTYKNIEVIVVHQGEDSKPVNASGEVRWIRQNIPNRALAKNRGMQVARGEILLFCDDDIIPEPSMVEAHVQAHSDPGLGGVSCRVTEAGLPPISSTNICRVTSYGKMIDGFQSDTECRVETLVGANMSIKRRVAREAGYFDVMYRGTAIFEEQDLSERIQMLGYKILFTNKSSVHHTPQPDGNLGQRQQNPASYYHVFHHNELVFFLKNRNRLSLLLVIPFCLLRSIKQSIRYRLSFEQGIHIFAGVFAGIRSYYKSMR